MTPFETFSTVVRLVPHWYQADHGPFRFETKVNGESLHFCTLRNLTPDLRSLWSSIQSNMPGFVEQAVTGTPSVAECLQETVVKRWLTIRDAATAWDKVIGYVRFLLNRTCENLPVAVNLIIDEQTGEHDITEPSLNKFIDQIASSPHTFLRCDRLLRFISYEEIPWSAITDPSSYTFHPEFLHPFHCILKSTPSALFSVHITRNRDAVIMDKEGIVAARRKGEWRIYDVKTFKNSIGDAMKDYSVGANLFGVLFDLSFKRHGALLVSDRQHKVVQHLVNRDCLLENGASSRSAQYCIAAAIEDVAIGGGVGAIRNHRRLLSELASIDGAVIFDDDHVLAVGAVIEPHPDVGSHIGARTTAALSAMHWGGIPAKVSSDGDVTIYFESRGEGASSPATILFT